MKIPPWSLSVASYNLLCDAYIKPEHFADRDPEDLKPGVRHPRLDARIAAFGTDAICTQETDHATFIRLSAKLRPLGYDGHWTHRPNGKPDGLAIFARAPWRIRTSTVFVFDELLAKPVNRIAVASILERDGHAVCAVNTHLEWHADDVPDDEKHGIFQAMELAGFLAEMPAIVCGDFNAVPESEVLALLRAIGYTDAHGPHLPTYGSTRGPVKLDYMLHPPSYAATPSPTARVVAGKPLPSPDEPSDHIPLVATFSPRS